MDEIITTPKRGVLLQWLAQHCDQYTLKKIGPTLPSEKELNASGICNAWNIAVAEFLRDMPGVFQLQFDMGGHPMNINRERFLCFYESKEVGLSAWNALPQQIKVSIQKYISTVSEINSRQQGQE